MMRTVLLLLLAAAANVAAAAPASACVTGFSKRALSIHLAHVRVDPFGLVTRGDRAGAPLSLASRADPTAQDARCGALLRVTPISTRNAITNRRGADLGLELTADAQAGAPSTRQANAILFALSRPDALLNAEVVEGLATGSGRFEGAFRLELTTDDEGEVIDVAELLVTTVIPPAVSIRFDDARGAPRKTLDFARMIPGDARHLTLHVAATTAYVIAVSSENGAVMVNPNAGSRADTPYQLLVDGKMVALGKLPTELAVGDTGLDGLARQMHDIAVVLQKADGYAGRYQDTITFTVYSVY